MRRNPALTLKRGPFFSIEFSIHRQFDVFLRPLFAFGVYTSESKDKGSASMTIRTPMTLPVPRNLTALMQHLQRLICRQPQYWCGGTVPVTKLAPFLTKMAERYPLLRTTRERTYDRKCRRAVVHLVVYPVSAAPAYADGAIGIKDGDAASDSAGSTIAAASSSMQANSQPTVTWWILSDSGSAGLADPASLDTHVARDSNSSAGHIEFRDYVLLYATKREARKIRDPVTDRTRQVWKDTSTWSWKIRGDFLAQLRTVIDGYCDNLAFGVEPTCDQAGSGLCGFLAAQRQRPLFSGVRNQVIDLHRYAENAWAPRRDIWIACHPGLAKQAGNNAGTLRPVAEVIAHGLPKMRRLRIYGEPVRVIDDIVRRATKPNF
jgi:hypothetical protein